MDTETAGIFRTIAEHAAADVGRTTAHREVNDGSKLTKALRDLLECALQAPSDLCGEQRAWYLPRLTNAMTQLGLAFPRHLLAALEQARDPWGEPLVKDEPEPKKRKGK